MLKGTAYYADSEDKDFLEILLIERENEASIRATTTWGIYGTWTIDSVAKKQGQIYSTRTVFPTKGASVGPGELSEFHASISFRMTHVSDSTVLIEGVWREQGEAYKFSGELERIESQA